MAFVLARIKVRATKASKACSKGFAFTIALGGSTRALAFAKAFATGAFAKAFAKAFPWVPCVPFPSGGCPFTALAFPFPLGGCPLGGCPLGVFITTAASFLVLALGCASLGSASYVVGAPVSVVGSFIGSGISGSFLIPGFGVNGCVVAGVTNGPVRPSLAFPVRA